MVIDKFNLRVYGLLLRNGCLLVTDENRGGVEMTKFPGGGLEFGEGLKDCLKREFLEEMGINIQVKSFFYTNDFLQVSRFNKKEQLHSFYFFVETEAKLDHIEVSKKNTIDPGRQEFRWIKFSETNEILTFPIDRVVLELLKGKAG